MKKQTLAHTQLFPRRPLQGSNSPVTVSPSAYGRHFLPQNEAEKVQESWASCHRSTAFRESKLDSGHSMSMVQDLPLPAIFIYVASLPDMLKSGPPSFLTWLTHFFVKSLSKVVSYLDEQRPRVFVT